MDPGSPSLPLDATLLRAPVRHALGRDAAQVVAAFSSTLRQEVDLDDLREQLIAVVQETMQPTHVALWLRSASQVRNPNIHTVRSSTS